MVSRPKISSTTAQLLDSIKPVNLSSNETFEAVLQRYISRRAVLKGGIASLVLASTGSLFAPGAKAAASAGFTPVSHSAEDKILVPPGYTYNVIIRWGDPVLPGAPEFDPRAQTPEKQAQQFGYNCDFLGFLPLPYGTQNSTHGLLAVNHEFTNPELMFPGWDGKKESKTREMVDIELAAHGLSIIEIRRDSSGAWSYVKDSPYNRRLPLETPITISGPAAGHPWLTTSYDPTGTLVWGTLNNCAGGITPWGTILTAEENIQNYFAEVETVTDETLKAIHKRYGIRDRYGWGRYHSRFDLSKEPREPLRFGWIVEIDPYQPRSVPVKRTALGRFSHEAATIVITPERQVVAYTGDDRRFEYLYKFVSAGRYNPTDREANKTLLDSGTLYVAKFHDDGTGEWLPLVFGQGPLKPANGFGSQAEVLINTRRAADLLGATKMDRPEDVQANPKTGKVYAALTNNTQRKPEQVDKANPRPNNRYGHIIEITEDGGNHAATTFHWEIFIACGDPNNPEHQAFYQGHKEVSWFSCPDNVAFDDQGRLWITTDGQPSTIEKNDGAYVVETEGPQRGMAKMFFSAVPGAEVCGPEFTPDNQTFFVAVQHPGDEDGATFEKPASRFPDYQPDMPPRPSVIAIYRPDGGKIGT